MKEGLTASFQPRNPSRRVPEEQLFLRVLGIGHGGWLFKREICLPRWTHQNAHIIQAGTMNKQDVIAA